MTKEQENLMNIDIDINAILKKIPKDDDNVALFLRYNKKTGGVSRTLISNAENIIYLLTCLVFSEGDGDKESEVYFREAMLNLSITILKEYSKENVDIFLQAVRDNCK